MASKAAGGKNRKYGRMKKWCERYRIRKTKERNQLRRVSRHAARHPNCKVAATKIKVLKIILNVA